MNCVNKVTLIGYLGKDPEIQILPGNIPLAKCSVATREQFTDKEGVAKEHTEWHQIVLWRKLGLLARDRLSKGSYIYVEGKLRTTAFEDKRGQIKYKTEVLVDEIIILKDNDRSSSDLPGTSLEQKIVPPVDKDGNEILPFS